MTQARRKRDKTELKEFASELFSKAGQDNLPRLASSFSFFALLSLAPFLVLSVTLAAFAIGKSDAAANLLRDAQNVGGPQVSKYVSDVIQGSQKTGTSAIATFLSLLVTFYSASNLFLNLDDAVNFIWGIKPPPGVVRNLISTRIIAFISVLLFGSILLGWLVLDSVMGWLAAHSGQHAGFEIVSFIASVIFLSLGFSVTIKALPRGRLKWRDAWLGGSVAGFSISLSKYLLTIYFAHISGPYGATGGIVILLLWMYYMSMIYFFSIEITYAFAHRFGSLKGKHEQPACLDFAKEGLKAS